MWMFKTFPGAKLLLLWCTVTSPGKNRISTDDNWCMNTPVHLILLVPKRNTGFPIAAISISMSGKQIFSIYVQFFCLQVLGFDEDHRMQEGKFSLLFVEFTPFLARMADPLNMITVSRKVLAITSLRYGGSVTIPITLVLTSELLGFLLKKRWMTKYLIWYSTIENHR